MNQLEKYREELMACNEKILEGLLQRNAVVEELMAYKEENKMPMLVFGLNEENSIVNTAHGSFTGTKVLV